MNSILIYLAGSISWYWRNNCLEECFKWRDDITNQINMLNRQNGLSFKVFNPCDCFNENTHYNNSSIVKQNLYYLKKSDLMIVNTKHLLDSPGTIFEMTYFYLNQKPIIAFGDDFLNYPHINIMVDEYFKNIKEIILYIENMYRQLN